MSIDVPLPAPWAGNLFVSLDERAPLTWLVGPNGTGKTRFLAEIHGHPALASQKPRLLSADRIASARTDYGRSSLWGNPIATGLPRTQLSRFIESISRDGSILGVVALLHERPDLRVRIEATLSQLLNRSISLEMRDGNLVPRARWGASAPYDLFSGECHGVLELIVLLANIYDDETELLLIDEPEQNLHPQYQAFVLAEIIRARKRAVLATHSPTFLRVRTLEDLRSVICFHERFLPPSTYRGDAQIDQEVEQILPRMTEQHRNLFFSTRPVIVEGLYDAIVLAAIQGSMGLLAEAAGSCLLPAMGKDEAGRYLQLCQALGKQAAFVFDLDSLFDQRLSTGANQNPELARRVASSGHGTYTKYLGELQRVLSDLDKKVQRLSEGVLPVALRPLRGFMEENAGPSGLDKRRFALLVAIAEQANALVESGLESECRDAAGRLSAVLDHLKAADIWVLPGGALENYLPEYVGNRFKVPEELKRPTAQAEVRWLATKRDAAEVRERYRDLTRIVEALPAKPTVDVLPVLRREIAMLLHVLLVAIRGGEVTGLEAAEVLKDQWFRVRNFISLAELRVESSNRFVGLLSILDRFGIGQRWVRFDPKTQPSDPSSLVLEELRPTLTLPSGSPTV